MVSGKATLTAIIPVKNLEKISSNIYKLFTQDLANIRLIIVLDEVDSFTKEFIYNLVKSNEKCETTILEGKFGNPGEARNAGMALSKSDWICFWDADDLPEISNILKEIGLKGLGSDIIVGQFVLRDWSTDTVIGRNQIQSSLEAVAMNPGLWRHVFRKEAVEGIMFPELKMAEDQVFLAQVYSKTQKVKFSDLIFYNYYKNVPNQLTSNRENLDDLEESLAILLKLFDGPSSFREILLVRQFVTLMAKRISFKKSRFELCRDLGNQIPRKRFMKILLNIWSLKFTGK